MLAWILISLTIIAITLFAAYRVALNENRVRLAESSHSYTQLIEAVARFDSKYSGQDHPEGSWGATYSQVLDALRMSRDLSLHGQVAIIHQVRRELVMISNAPGGDVRERIVEVRDPMYEVFRQGLNGQAGDYFGEDRLGRDVLMAYRPAPAMGLLVVVRLPVWRIQQPFIQTGLWVFGAGLVLMFGGIAVGMWWSRRMEATTRVPDPGVRDMVLSSDEALVLLDANQCVLELSPMAITLLGGEASRASGPHWHTLFLDLGSKSSGTDDELRLPGAGERLEARARGEDEAVEPVTIDAIRFDQNGTAYHLLRIGKGAPSANAPESEHEATPAMEQPAPDTSLSGQVKELIKAGLPKGDAAVKIIAPRLGMSVRSLQRQLGEEGTSFSDLLNGTRQELCLHYLDQGRLGLDEIASQLGYSDLTNFHRAFKRWTGLTPGRYRRRVMTTGVSRSESGDVSGPPGT